MLSVHWLPVQLFCITPVQTPPAEARLSCLWLTTITLHSETRVQRLCFQPQQCLKLLLAKQKKSPRCTPVCASPRLPSTAFSFTSLLNWFLLTWQSCGSYGRRCYKCSVTTLNMAGSERLDSSSDATRRRCSAPPPPVWLQPLSLISTTLEHFLCLPRSAGLVLILARESTLPGRGGKEKRWKRQTLDAKGNDAYKSKQFSSWFNKLFVCKE